MTVDQLQAENARFRKLYWLAAQDVVFFSSWDEASQAHRENDLDFFSPCVGLNDTFAYACADAEALTDDQIDSLIFAYRNFGGDGVTAWGALRRKCEPLPQLRTEKYHAARAALQPGAEQ